MMVLASAAGCDEDRVTAPGGPVPEPNLVIEYPPPSSRTARYTAVTTFEAAAAGENTLKYARYFFSPVVDTAGVYDPDFDFIADLNDNLWRYEEKWSPWTRIDPGAPSISVTIGDDEKMILGRYYFIAFQGKGTSGSVTTVFDKNINVRHFQVAPVPGPFLRVYERLVGSFRFSGTRGSPVTRRLPPGIGLDFIWMSDNTTYYGELAGYRCGWDIEDTDLWNDPFDLKRTGAATATFHSGTHTLYIEAVDRAGNLTRGRIIVEIVPWTMERDLLVVDDFFSYNSPVPDLSWPPEYEHDAFWTSIASKAAGFDESVDIYDCVERGSAPGVEEIGLYKNIIWTFSAGNSRWGDIIYFIPESQIGELSHTATNILSVFLQKGGHTWTSGRSDQIGGLAATFDDRGIFFPMNLACEIAGTRGDCAGDRSGRRSFPYLDFCVTMLDKIVAPIRTDDAMPYRQSAHYDVMISAFYDRFDPVSARYPQIPDRLELRDDVTAPGKYFSTDSTSLTGGFSYVEVYDPEYWMESRSVFSQYCFHPAFRMRAAGSTSALNDCAVALWLTKYEDIVPDPLSGPAVAAPSIHFGFPLWFFRHETVDSIAAVIFDRWGILGAGGEGGP